MPTRSDDTYLFIDGEYMRRVYKEAMQSVFAQDGEINFYTLKSQAVAKRVFFYDCLDDLERAGETEPDYKSRVGKQESFFDGIRALSGFHVRLGSLKGTPKKPRQKEVDVLLASDMLTHGYDGNMARAVLIAGDLDFRPIVEALVRRGVFVDVWFEMRSGAKELPTAADFGRALTFHELYSWSSDAFRLRCSVPVASRAHGPLHPTTRYVPIKGGTLAGRKVILFHDNGTGTYVLRLEQSDGVLWFDYGDSNVLLRYFEIVYGPVNWTS
jgi:uncharacterized LabA/DUF88 family protein